MREYGSNINLPSLDNLFSSEQERQDAKLEKIQILPLTELHPFRNHPFQVRDDDEMDKMVDSIKEYGVMTPAIVRPRKDGGYEIVAGHRRCHASQRAGVETMPCIVRDMDDDTAIILMVDSNCQREHILPSEKAKAYEMKLEAIRRKAGRPSKENSRQVGANFSGVKTTQIIGEQSGDSTRQVERFIRLNKLTPELMQMVDDGKLKTTPAVELSYLTPEEQEDFLSYMESEGCTPSLSQAQKLKEASKESVLTPEKIQHIMAAKPPSVKPRDPQLMADEYLSGNVREKLRIAHVAADQDPAFRINVEALEQVQPKDLTAGEITVRLGVTWIGPEIIKQFADELFQSTYREQKIAVRYNEYLNNWYISNKSQGNDNIRVTNTYGTKRINGYHLLENALNLRAPKFTIQSMTKTARSSINSMVLPPKKHRPSNG